jgi:hypothetical protein
MTPEEAQSIQEHSTAIAEILYRNSDPESIKDLGDIERIVRQHMLEIVGPQVGIFLSKQRQKRQQGSHEQ